MPFTCQYVIDELTNTVQRDDVAPKYLSFVNEAVRELARMHSFLEMKATGTGTVAVNATRAALPADFKELQNSRYSVFDAVSGGLSRLAPVFIRSEVEKLLGAGLVPPTGFIYTQDFTEGTASFRLDLVAPAAALHTLSIFYFAYPAEIPDPSGGATTPLITYYFNLVKEKALSIAFKSINDPVANMHEQQFLTEFGQQTGEDVKQALAQLRPTNPR